MEGIKIGGKFAGFLYISRSRSDWSELDLIPAEGGCIWRKLIEIKVI